MEGLRAQEDDLLRALQRVAARSSFVELLARRSEGRAASVNQKVVSQLADPGVQGVVLRAWAGGRWVEVAGSGIDRTSLDTLTENALGAIHPNGGPATPPGELSNLVGDWATRPARPAREVTPEELVAVGQDILRWARTEPSVRDILYRGAWAEEESAYLNTAGARAYQRLSRVTAAFAAIAFDGGNVQAEFNYGGGLGGREILERITEEEVRDTAQRAAQMLHAEPPPSGSMPVVLDHSAAGIFAHESFGHGTEADQFLRDRSYLKPLLGKELGPEILTLIDDGSLPGGWGSYYFDDEGTAAHRTMLVDHGRFVGALHDRATAAALGARPTGNARRADFLSREYVRMSNTIVAPGDWSMDELLHEARDGLFLERAMSGLEDPQGGQMQIKVRRGRRIVHGELGPLVGSTALSGRVLEFLRSIRGVGKADSVVIDPGTCGKGSSDLLPVGDGGGAVLSTAVVGPA
jgi:TldD protein